MWTDRRADIHEETNSHISNFCGCAKYKAFIIIIIIIIIILLTAIELSLGGSGPYTSTDKTNKNKYT